MSTSDRSATMLRDPAEVRSRVPKLEAMLERYRDLTESATPSVERGHTGSHMPARPHDAGCVIFVSKPPRCSCWQRDIAELERLIRQLRDTRHGPIVKWTTADGKNYEASPRRLWWHLNAWWIDVDRVLWTPPLRPQKNKRKQLRALVVDQDGRALPQVRVLRKAEARYPIALKAVETLAEQWALPHEPMLPRELQNAA